MTLVNIDLQNAGYETGLDDRVVFYSPANRNEQGRIISTAEKTVELADGQATVELAPGPVVVHILAQGVADTRPKSGYVPEEGPVALWDVVLDWTPALVDQGILAILVAVDEALSQVGGAVDSAIGTRLDGKSNVGHKHESGDITGATSYISNFDDRFAGRVVKLNAEGKLVHSEVPVASVDLVNKAYADKPINEATSYLKYRDNRFAGRLIRANLEGKVRVDTVAVTDEDDPTSKGYVDGAINALRDEIGDIVPPAPPAPPSLPITNIRRIFATSDPDTPMEEGDMMIVLDREIDTRLKVFTDFSNGLAGTTPRWSWPSGWKAIEMPGTLSGTVAQTDYLGSKRLLSLDAANAGSADVELVTRFRQEPIDLARSTGIAALRSSGEGEAENGYTLQISDVEARIGRYINGTFAVMARTSIPYVEGVWYWARFRAIGTTLQARIWQDGTPEPDDWQMNATDSTHTDPGWVGAWGTTGNNPQWWDRFGVAFDGRRAPVIG